MISNKTLRDTDEQKLYMTWNYTISCNLYQNVIIYKQNTYQFKITSRLLYWISRWFTRTNVYANNPLKVKYIVGTFEEIVITVESDILLCYLYFQFTIDLYSRQQCFKNRWKLIIAVHLNYKLTGIRNIINKSLLIVRNA